MNKVIPTIVQSTTAGFTPAFPFTGIDGDRHADAFAVIASIVGVPLFEVFKQAEALGLPKTGPYSHCVDSELISSLLAAYGWACSEWKEVTSLTHFPTLSICIVDYDEEWEVGRYIWVHSGAKCSHNGAVLTYCADPSAIDLKLQIRTDIKALKPSWYLGLQPMKAASTSAKK